MAAFTRPHLTTWAAPAGGAIAGLIVATAFLAIPKVTLEDMVWRSGIPAFLPVAAPPLGVTARAILALSGGVLAAAITWAALFLLFGPGGLFDRHVAAQDDSPMVRRADAHPDAPARKPLSTRDLGAPMPPIASAGRAIPANLDLPLAAFDPAAVPAEPRQPARPVASLRRPVALGRGERISSVELPRKPDKDTGAPSIEALLRRLEQSTQRQVAAR